MQPWSIHGASNPISQDHTQKSSYRAASEGRRKTPLGSTSASAATFQVGRSPIQEAPYLPCGLEKIGNGILRGDSRTESHQSSHATGSHPPTMGFLSGSQNKWERPAFNDHNLGDSDDYDVELARPQHVRSPKIHRSMEAFCERLDTPTIQVPPRAPEIGRLPTLELEPLLPLCPSFCACCHNAEASRSTSPTRR